MIATTYFKDRNHLFRHLEEVLQVKFQLEAINYTHLQVDAFHEDLAAKHCVLVDIMPNGGIHHAKGLAKTMWLLEESDFRFFHILLPNLISQYLDDNTRWWYRYLRLKYKERYSCYYYTRRPAVDFHLQAAYLQFLERANKHIPII